MRIIKSIIGIVSVMTLIVMMASCKPGVPDEYIQPGEMEDILYDYHLAMAMADQGDMANRDVRVVAYKEAVLKKYGYTDGQFQASMEYYMRHTERLHDIYDNLAERFDDEAKDLGASGSNITENYSQNGDTANVWKGPRAMVLMPKAGFNSYSFSVKVDTAFHVGDRLSMQFNSSYIIQDGSRNAVAVIAMTLDNDSVVSQVIRISSDSHQASFFGGFLNNRIKAIKGYILFPPDNGILPSTTLKILCLIDIQLLRMHQPKNPSMPGSPAPSGPGAPSTLNPHPSTLNPPPSTLNPHPSTSR